MNVPFGLRGWLLVAAVAVVVVGCHKKDDVVPPVAPTATPTAGASATATPTPTATPVVAATLAPTQAQTTGTIADAAGSITVSGGPGALGGVFDYAASTSGGTDSATLLMTTTIPTVPGTIPGTPLAAFELQLNNAWTFSNGYVVTPLTLPNGYVTTGLSFFEYVYDTTEGMQIGSAIGPATATGDTLTFPSPSPAATLSANALDTYAVVLTATAQSSPTTTGTPVKY
ncbi:MAG: hypothetical protein ABR975_15075 [Vulcanimicrobiaceae bacterium]|jgi:hypothetical protein